MKTFDTALVLSQKFEMIDMKLTANKSLFLSIVLTLVVAFSANAQNATSFEDITIVTENEAGALLITTNKSIAAINMTSWFSGAALSVKGTSVQGVVLPSKKEQYLQFGLSTKTLLIRALMKKADRQYNGTA